MSPYWMQTVSLPFVQISATLEPVARITRTR
jgi:hypothetical protein